MSFLKPKAATSSSVSENTNNGLITSTYGGTMQNGVTAGNYLQSLLTGQGDTGAAQAGYQNYLQNAGYQPAMTQLARGITGQGAASGLLNSGATAQALQTRGTQLNQQFYNNYLQQLMAQQGLGIQAGGLVSNAGQRSTQNSTGGGPSTFGSIASTVGGLASIFSDRRLKENITLDFREADGLGRYFWNYVGQTARVWGVMADEVAKFRPWALGRKVGGFQTVNYGAL